MQLFTFYYVTTGESRLAHTDPNAESPGWVTSLLQSAIAGVPRGHGVPQGGNLPDHPGYVCYIATLEGGALFGIRGPGGQLLNSCGVACTAEAAAKVWPYLEGAQLDSYQAVVQNWGFDTPDHFLTIPKLPAELPWIAVAHLPGLGQEPESQQWVISVELELGKALLLEAISAQRL